MGLLAKDKINHDKKRDLLKKKASKLKRKNNGRLDGPPKKPKIQKTKECVSSKAEKETELMDDLDRDSGNNRGSDKPLNQKKELDSYRLFVKMKNKMINEKDVKNMHPDVISVRFPRKKRTRWCWAIFGNEEKAAKALKELQQRKDIIVDKPKESFGKKKKSGEAKMKKEIKNKLLETWL